MVYFKYIDLIRAIQNDDTIQLIGGIDVNLLDSNSVESLYYSLPLIERMVLEIYKLVPESDVEHYEQGIMKTPISIIDSNIDILPENAASMIKRIYGDGGIRNKLFHVVGKAINIKVNFEEINFLIMQLLSILRDKINENKGFIVKDISYLE